MPAGLHTLFRAPTNPPIKIWRYMDFTKFVSLLDSRSLFFARSDKLGDPFEGSFPTANLPKRSEVAASLWFDLPEKLAVLHERMRLSTYICCWHMNEYESAAMWSLYTKTNESIAIQSTYARLCECLTEEIFVGEMDYIDYEHDVIPEGNLLQPFLYKRKSFEHEREIRALTTDFTPYLKDIDQALEEDPPQTPVGIGIPIDLDRLIEQVYVSPTAPSWFRDLVASLATKYEVNKPVVQSTLDATPVF